MGLAVLAACGGGSGSSSSSTGAPAVTLSVTSLTLTSTVNTASAAGTVTVTNSGTATLTITGITTSASSFAETNTCSTGIAAGGTCTISVAYTPTGTAQVTGTLTITDNASGSPQTVSLTGNTAALSLSTTSLAFSVTTTTGTVTLNNSGSSTITISSIAITAGSSNFSQTNTCGSSLTTSGTCAVNVTFTPPTTGTAVTGTLTLTDSATGSPQTISLSGTGPNANTAAITVSFGPNGYLGGASSDYPSYYDGVFVTVTVCSPGSTTNCTTIPNVLVDTGSVGLRLLGTGVSGVTTQVDSLNLPTITDPSTGYPLNACVQYGDLSYTWGAMEMATVTIGGEAASTTPGGSVGGGIPIQVMSTAAPPADVSYEGTEYANPCLVYPGTSTPTDGLDDDTVANLGANGLLGIGLYPQDCGANCTAVSTSTGEYVAFESSTGAAYVVAAPLTSQAWNPVAAFEGTDTNGVMVSIPSVPAAGQATQNGTLFFGINTESNNQISTQTYYEVDCDGDFLQATYNGITYQDVDDQSDCSPQVSMFIDSGTSALTILDAATLGSATGVSVADCSDSGYYCPASTINLDITLYGDTNNSVSGNGSISIANADDLFSGNQYAAFSNLGAPSCTPTSTESCSPSTAGSELFDFGLPFFFARPIFVGIQGSNSTYPNGFWAF